MIEKHFVTFVSPGTFVSEQTTKEIDSWDIKKATEMARNVTERHSARPFCFYFTTRTNDGELDSKVTATSRKYYLGGQVQTREEIEDRNDPSEEILRSNLRANGIDRVVVNCNSWKSVLPLDDGDIVLDVTL